MRLPRRPPAVVLTYRELARAQATEAQLAAWGIGFDELVIAPSMESKGELCRVTFWHLTPDNGPPLLEHGFAGESRSPGEIAGPDPRVGQ